MAKLTENTVRTFESNEDVNTVLVAAGVHIFQGEFIGINGGYARPYEKGDTVALRWTKSITPMATTVPRQSTCVAVARFALNCQT